MKTTLANSLTETLVEIAAPAAPIELPPFALCYSTHPQQPHCRALYVSALPGENGADWGYTLNPQGTPNPNAAWDGGPAMLDVAKPLNRYWQRRFAADCRRTRVTFHAIACRSETNANLQAGWPTIEVRAESGGKGGGK